MGFGHSVGLALILNINNYYMSMSMNINEAKTSEQLSWLKLSIIAVRLWQYNWYLIEEII